VDSRISLRKLEILCLVVELGGVGRAAERLHVSQPVVTAHMRLLQDRLGVELLYRDGQQMRLTEAGEEAYRWACEVMGRSREVERTLDGIAQGSAGPVAVASSMSMGSYVLPRVVAAFAVQRPGARLTLHVSDSEDAQRAAESGDCDFAVITGSSVLSGGVLQARQIGTHDLVLVASPDDNRVGESVDAAELATLPFICSPVNRPRRRQVEATLAEVGVTRRHVLLELGHPEALKAAVRMGTGVALLLRAAVAQDLCAGQLREVTIDGHQLQVPVLLVHRADKRFTPMQRQLLAAIAAEFAGATCGACNGRAALPA
jgi:LysR family transcriptional regulator, low CO2-responsive transcriptional regulator